ncbi:amidohydrolase [Actinoalloteichus hoggarensis]|uniref:Putative hydrolase YxeP n=1 Tax=Actinoalloteichus hoggarensis TaxID=1470176 RepID=A0A221WA45_9PSEU|nr:amidohydrolase [Actinoalloteichus hoggarensis]ASO22591.1 putative hydrolase YxeP [Actinoalloteichus hoggarensis]MBB5922984.1 amidohydrolase [Actinoalloteichus hoggarensis]
MTVLDSRYDTQIQTDVDPDSEFAAALPAGVSGARSLLGEVAPAAPTMAEVEDIGAGHGPPWLDAWLAEHGADVVRWRRHLHAHPELSLQEYGTTAYLSEQLTAAGLRPRVLPSGTGLICDVGSGPRCVALRGDIDALPLTESTGALYASTVPGVTHACGHDAHATVLLGTALALAAAPSLPGRVRLLFQPAEEVMRGALDVIAAGGLDGVDRVFGLHCDPRLEVGKVGTRVGAITSASDLMEIRFTSPGGHTSRPHLTGDLVHAMGTVITGLPTLLSRRVDPRSSTVLVWGAVHAGEAPNAIPQDGVLRGTLRTGDHETWEKLEPLIKELVGALLAPTGVSYELWHQRGVPPLVNERESTALIQAGVTAALGDQAIVDTEQSSGGEDFGWYLEQAPGAFARLGVWSGTGRQRDLHQPSFDLDERALLTGVRVLAHTALASLTAESDGLGVGTAPA